MSTLPPTRDPASVGAVADAQAVAEAVAAGRPVDPEVARRVRQRADEARARTGAGPDVGVQIIREARGPLEDEPVQLLTPGQRDLVRQGQVRLTDPDTGTTFVLVPEEEYNRLRGTGR